MGKVTLYHFTARHLANSIAEHGIIRGFVARHSNSFVDASGEKWMEGVYKVPGFVWLTTNPSWDQEWQRISSLPYSRVAVRFTVELPKSAKLYTWRDLRRHLKLTDSERAVHEACGGQEHWRIHKGTISRTCLKLAELNPNCPDLYHIPAAM